MTVHNNLPLKRFLQAVLFGVCGLWCLISIPDDWPRFYSELHELMGIALLVAGLVYFILSVQELNASANG